MSSEPIRFSTPQGTGYLVSWRDVFHAGDQTQAFAEELLEDPRYASGGERSKNRDGLNAALAPYLKRKTSAQWIDILNEAGVPCGPIYSIDQVFADEHVKHIGIAQPVRHPQLGELKLVGQAVSLSRTPTKLRTAAPEQGEHNEQILAGLGFNAEEIAGLKKDGVI